MASLPSTWDVAYTMAVHGAPRAVLHRLLDGRLFMQHLQRFARVARRMQATARWKDRVVDAACGRPSFLQLLIDNTNRDHAGDGDLSIQPNIDSSPFAQPIAPAARTQGVDGIDHAVAAGGLS